MSMSWLEISEIVTGMAIAHRIPVQSIRPDVLFPPYDGIIEALKSGKSLQDIIISGDVDHIQTAIAAEENINGTGDKVDWVNQLEQSFALYQDADELQRLSKKMKSGDLEAGLKAREIVHKFSQRSVGTNFRSVYDVDPKETPYIETGWGIFDQHTGGLPAVGITIVGGSPGSGKTEFAKTIARSFVKKYKDKTVAIFSLEMMCEELSGRFKLKGTNDEDYKRIIMDDTPFMKTDMVVSRAATVENLGLVLIDFADLLVMGKRDEAEYSSMYMYLMQAAKQLLCPIVILAQFSRNYSGGIPRPFHLYYTGLAEALGWSIFTLYNPNTDYFADSEDKEILPPIPGYAYICCWKQRGGFRIHPNDSPGAICLPFKGGAGWHPTKGNWVYIQKSKKKG